MIARKKAILIGSVQDKMLRGRLLRKASSDVIREEMEKDAHLIEAALQFDGIVLSRDETMRQLLNEAAHEIQELRNILWANPAIEDEGVLLWLERGAKMEAARRLGRRDIGGA